MGLDLNLLPFDADLPGAGRNYSHTILSCDRRTELFDEIIKIENQSPRPVPDDFTSYCSRDSKYEDTHYGLTIKTPYGDRLRYVTAEELLWVRDHPGVVNNVKNRAIWAYLAALPVDTKIALYWH